MGKVNYAAIDIGSNAVRLLIKSIDREAVQEKKIKKVMMLRVPLRLGFDVFSIGELSEKKADKLRRLMKAFRQLMKIYGKHSASCVFFSPLFLPTFVASL